MNGLDFNAVTSRYFTEDQAARIKAARIGIAGAGGLGSNCAHALARCGFEKFIIVDFDLVEAHNLNRQFYFADQVGRPKVEALKENLRRINPEITMKTLQIRLDAQNLVRTFESCDAVVEAFDKAENKAMLVRALAGSGKLVVTASGLAGFGNSNRIVTKMLRPDLYQVGDGHSAVDDMLKPLAPCVAIAAAKQADVVLCWVLGK
jgi:sulfur carrier protein ThiS adenylyltransferase